MFFTTHSDSPLTQWNIMDCKCNFCYQAGTDVYIVVYIASYLIPRVEQHDVVLAEVILGEPSHLRDNEAACLIGAFKQARLVV